MIAATCCDKSGSLEERNMQHFEFGWQTGDGLSLFARGWQPEGETRAAVCLVHGLGEHSGRYPHVAAALTQAGYAFLAPDLRGHGRSKGQRGHAPSWDRLLDDTAQLLEQADERFPDLPRFLYGHSLGATLVLTYALRRNPNPRGVIATGPLLRPASTPPRWKLTLGRLLYGLWPTFSLNNELDPKGVSRDPEVVDAYVNDPLVHDRVSARLGLDMLEAGEWVLEHADQLRVPLLLMQGSDDLLCSTQAGREFAERTTAQCTSKFWSHLYHEIHNEPEQQQVFETMISWLNDRLTD
jgi:acylglycerol lipase